MILLIAIGLAIFVVPDPWKVPVVVAGGAIEAAETAIEVWWSRRQRPTVGPEAITAGSSCGTSAAEKPSG